MNRIFLWIIAFISFSNLLYGQVTFESSGQQLDRLSGRGVALGDFNEDGSLDAFVGTGNSYRVYFGDGNGLFIGSSQNLSTSASNFNSPVVSDINNDGQLEVITGNTIWFNDGKGNFTSRAAVSDNVGSVQIADLNGDGHLDLFAIVNYSASRVYFNDGAGNFTNSGQRLGDGTIGSGQIAEIALGDINHDGSIDAVTAGWRWNNSTQCPNQIWMNDGTGHFTLSSRQIEEGGSHVHGISLLDLNSDGWLDLILAIQDGTRCGRIYMNDQTGNLIRGSNIPSRSGEDVEPADFNGDGIIDIFIAQSQQPSRVWLNDGNGNLTDGGARLGNNCYWDTAVGDFNSDGRPDIFAVGFIWGSGGAAPVDVWLNTTPIPEPNDNSASAIDYLGQTPPGSTAEIFDSTFFNPEGWNIHSVPVFTPDGNEVYFSVYNLADNNYHVIMCIRKDADGTWSEPGIVPFSGLHIGNLPVIDDYPFITPDGEQLFFCSDRLTPQKIGWQNADIYFVTRTDSGWSEPVQAAIPIGQHQMDIYPTVATNGNLYFTGGTTKYGLYLSEKLGENEYTRPVLLGNGINSDYSEWNSYIAPDEDYYIFSSMRITDDWGELLICYKQSNGQWSTPVNMGGTINSVEQEKYPVVTPDGKYLFFVRSWVDRDEIYWLSSQIIDDLRNYDPYLNYPIPNVTAVLDSPFTFTISENTFIDDDGRETLTFRATYSNNRPLPNWLSFDADTCTFSGTPHTPGVIGIKVTATDTTGKTVFDIFTITIVAS